MNKGKFFLPIVFFFFLTFFLLWDVFIKGNVPVPADILVGHYYPWKDYVWEGKVAGFPIGNFHLYDIITQVYPWRWFSGEMLKRGEFPLWNPYNLLGAPHLANLPTASLYPLNAIFLILPFLPSWVFYLFIQTILSGTFMYFFLKNLKLKTIASLFGGVAFSFSSFMMMRYEFGIANHTLLWVPLALLAVDKMVKNFSLKWWFVGIGALTLMFLGGYIQAMIYGYAVVLAYVVFRRWRKRKNWYFWVGFLVFPLLLASFQLVPFGEQVLQSSRIGGYGAFEKGVGKYILPWHRLVGILAPDFFGNPATGNFWEKISYTEFALYVGIVPLIFAIYAIFRVKTKNVRFWFLILLIAFALILDTPLAKVPYLLNIPGYSALIPIRLVLVIDLAIPILAAFGLSKYQRATRQILRKETYILLFINASLLAILFLIWIFLFQAHRFLPEIDLVDKLAISKRNLILPTFYALSAGIALSLLLIRRFKKLVGFILLFLLLLTSFDLLRQARKFNPFVPKSVVFPRTKSLGFLQDKEITPRIMITHPELIPANTNILYKLSMLDGYSSVHTKRTGELMMVLNSQDVEARTLRPKRDMFFPNKDSLAINLLSPEYVFTLDEELKDARFELVIKEGRTRIYKNLLAYPRVYLTKEVEFAVDPKQILQAVLNFSKKGKLRAVLEEKINLSSKHLDSTSKAELMEYSPNKVLIRTSSNTDSFLVFNDSYDKGWRAFIDNKETRIYRTNYALRGLIIPEGEHEVYFVYRPDSFFNGLKISGLSALSLIMLGFVLGRRKPGSYT